MADSQPTLFGPEIWKPVVGYEGLYEVSDHGRVRSLDRYVNNRYGLRKSHGQILFQRKTNSGYSMTMLSREDKKKAMLIHRLVAAAFIGPCPEKMQVDHIDNDKLNNHVSNLRYLTPKENVGRQKSFGNSLADRAKTGTHHQTIKTHCPYGHPLEHPNLVASHARKGYRKCISCARSRSYLKTRPSLRVYHQEISDSYYEKLMRS